MNEEVFQGWLQTINQSTPPSGHEAALALNQSWLLLRAAKETQSRLTSFSWWAPALDATIQQKMDNVASLAGELDLVGELSPDQVSRWRSITADALIQCRSVVEATDQASDQFTFMGGLIDYFKNWTTYASEGAQAVATGAGAAIDYGLGKLLDSTMFKVALILGFILLARRK